MLSLSLISLSIFDLFTEIQKQMKKFIIGKWLQFDTYSLVDSLLILLHQYLLSYCNLFLVRIKTLSLLVWSNLFESWDLEEWSVFFEQIKNLKQGLNSSKPCLCYFFQSIGSIVSGSMLQILTKNGSLQKTNNTEKLRLLQGLDLKNTFY